MLLDVRHGAGDDRSGQYNAVIGTGKYYLQREWSSHSNRCVLNGK